jgi:hypothetical protein
MYMKCHVLEITLIWPSIAGLSTTEDIMRSNMLLGTLNLHIAEIACIVLYMICHVKVITLIWPPIAGLSRTEDIMRSYMLLGTLNLHITDTINKNMYCQGVTKRCRLSWLTNTAIVYEPKCGERGRVTGSQPMSTAQINFGDLTPYLCMCTV